jgi:hypothetical protein
MSMLVMVARSSSNGRTNLAELSEKDVETFFSTSATTASKAEVFHQSIFEDLENQRVRGKEKVGCHM